MIEEAIKIPSEGLYLEGEIVYAVDLVKPQAFVLLCPPHPFLGGDMKNNVMSELARMLAESQHLVMTFNYRGIGRSETDRDLAEYQKEFWETSACSEYENKIFTDCYAAFDFMKRTFQGQYKEIAFYVIGYSFGCLPSLELMVNSPEIVKGCLISPPLAKWQFKKAHEILKQDKFFFYAPDDFGCPEEEILQAYEAFSPPKKIFKIEGAQHLYLGFEKRLAELILQTLSEGVGTSR